MFLISKLVTWFERSRLRQDLLRMDARTLADIGYSRELLEAGVRGWPWKAPVEPAAGLDRLNLRPRLSEADYATAIAELKASSDADLLDLAITRGGIEDAVRNGRPGFPDEQQRAA
jgi:uncharacterized protein YjiS (DUF1127 family)